MKPFDNAGRPVKRVLTYPVLARSAAIANMINETVEVTE